jgi:hypothetical protein
VKKTHTSSNLLLVIWLLLFVQTATPNELRERTDVLWEKHGIMQQFFMAFVTVDTTLAFMPPRARLEYSFPLRAASIRRTPEESFRDEVVLARV